MHGSSYLVCDLSSALIARTSNARGVGIGRDPILRASLPRMFERSSIDRVVRGVVLAALERFKSADSAGSDIASLC